MEHIEQSLSAMCERGCVPKDFDGEITVPGDAFDDASGLIRNKKSVPEAVFNIFDIPFDNRPKQQRWHHLNNLEYFISESDYRLKVIDHETVYNETDLMLFYHLCVDEGYEGIVIYDPKSLYEDKRCYSWMRLVPLCSADLRVIGKEEGKKSFTGTLGKIIVDFKGKECKVGTGFSKELRDDIWNNFEKYYLRIANIEYKEETKKGDMRQARFKCFRDDKTQVNVD